MYNIEEVIKHRKPMRLVDELISFNESSACVLVNINEDSEFYQDAHQGVPSYLGNEYMAQCIAAQAGANELASGRELKLGFLLGTRRYKPMTTYFKRGITLKVTATRLMEDAAGLSVFDCEIADYNQENTILVQSKVNVFQPEDSAAYLQD